MPAPAILRTYAKEWRKTMAAQQQSRSDQEVLQIREALVPEDERKAWLAQILGDDRLKDPIPAYETEETA